jgi:hypothetical protein
MTCIDVFWGDLLTQFTDNLKISGFLDKATIIKGFSADKLKDLSPHSFHIIYIDASHDAASVLTDAILSWPLLKDGGILIFDDYKLNPGTPVDLRPQVAIDAFITAFRNSLDLVLRDYQVFLRKREIPAGVLMTAGDYLYDWAKKELLHRPTGKLVPLSEKERALFEKLLNSRKFGETQFSPSPDLLQDSGFLPLMVKLRLSVSLENLHR